MKKLVLSCLFLLCLIGISACSNKRINITPDTITTNTFLAKSDGSLQVATVEDFDKTYYNLSELEEFVKKEISDYNKKVGGQKIAIDSIGLQEGKSKAVMLLSYSGMDQYCTFNQVSAAYFNGGVKDITMELPDTLVNAKTGSLSSTKEVISNTKYKVLVLSEPYEVMVQGKVVYYSDNTKLAKDKKIQTAAKGLSVIVYKPR